jgi:hypothetical protein
MEQASVNVGFAEIIDANHLVARSLTALQNDCALRNAQFFRQKPAQGRIRFSFHCWRPQFDLDRVSMLTDHRVALRIGNDVEP